MGHEEAVSGNPEIDGPKADFDSSIPGPVRSGAVRRRVGRFSDGFYQRAVCVAIGLYIGIYLYLGFETHGAFGTFAMDLGIYDQAAWLISQGKSYITVRGINTWGHHNNAVFYLFAPFYWLGAGPRFLMFVETTLLGLGALPVFRIAAAKFRSGKIGLFFAICYLLYPPTGWLAQWTFHPESLSVTAVLLAWWFAKTRRVVLLSVVVLFALSTREEVGLVIAMMGVVLLFSKSRLTPWPSLSEPVAHPRERILRWGIPLALLTVGLSWYLASTKILIPHFNDGGNPYYIKRFFGEFGSSSGEVVVNMVKNPDRVLKLASQPDAEMFAIDLIGPFGFLPLAGAPFLAICSPQLLAALIGAESFIRKIRFQYTALITPGVIIATIEGLYLMTRRRRGLLKPLMVWITITMSISVVFRSSLPFTKQDWVWKAPDAHTPVVERALKLVPKDARVGATLNIVPHLSHREVIYDFPNPFIAHYHGPDNNKKVDPKVIDWLVYDLKSLYFGDAEAAKKFLSRPEFVTVFSEDGMVIARRRSTMTPQELAKLRSVAPVFP